jgi:hypothetical protein
VNLSAHFCNLPRGTALYSVDNGTNRLLGIISYLTMNRCITSWAGQFSMVSSSVHGPNITCALIETPPNIQKSIIVQHMLTEPVIQRTKFSLPDLGIPLGFNRSHGQLLLWISQIAVLRINATIQILA